MNYITASRPVKFDVEDYSKSKTYEKFYEVFLAQANAKGYGNIVKKDDTVPKVSDANVEPYKSLYKSNIIGYSDLIVAVLDNSEAFQIVKASKDNTDYPDGNLQTALDDVKERFQMSDITEKERLETKWEKKRKLKKGENPVRLLNSLFILQKQLKRV